MASYFARLNKLGKPPAFDELAFEDNVNVLLQLLRRRLPATKVAIVTIPPIGEHLGSELNSKVRTPVHDFMRHVAPYFVQH